MPKEESIIFEKHDVVLYLNLLQFLDVLARIFVFNIPAIMIFGPSYYTCSIKIINNKIKQKTLGNFTEACM